MTRSTALPTMLALAAFAANSVLCRLALGDGRIDAPRFTAVRLLAGAVVLALLVGRGGLGAWRASVGPALALLGYAVGFSYAYVDLDTATGALLLFAAVQLTMVGVGLGEGERFGTRQLAGAALATAGVALLLLPGASAPPVVGAAWMLFAGMSWGVYSLLGREVQAPTETTARAFVLAAPVALLLAGPGAANATWTAEGLGLAALSGGVASGLGYAIWYRALRGHTATTAALVQLAVPVLAGIAGWLLLEEPLTMRLVVCGAATLGGIALGMKR